MGMEKLILEKKPHALVVGPFRSEALLAGMDMLAKHKVPLLGTIAMSPKTEAKVMKDPKYKYVFRVSLDAKYFVHATSPRHDGPHGQGVRFQQGVHHEPGRGLGPGHREWHP